MKNGNGNGPQYRFGTFRLDTGQRLLFRGDGEVRVPLRSLELLAFLVTRPNEVVDKETLINEVWSGSFVEEANLSVHISNLRKILAEANGNAGVSIETFPKVGYRLNAEVTVVTNVAGSNGQNVRKLADYQTPGKLDEPHVLSQKRWAKLAGFLIVILVVGGGGFMAARFLGHPGNEAMQMTRLPGTEQSPSMAISPDGEFLAHAVSRAGKRTLVITNIRSNSSFELRESSTDNYYGMVFSPDMGWLYFVSGDNERSSLYRVAILGGPVVKVVENVHHSVDISPDGTKLSFLRRVSPDDTAILTAAIDGTDERVLATKSKPERFSSSEIAWSPDGRTIAAAASSGQRGQSVEVVGVDVESGNVRPLSNRAWAGINGVDWLPGGEEIVAGLWETSTSPTHIWTVDVASGEAKKLTSDLKNYAIANVTRDGRTILTTEHKDESSVWLSSLDGSSPDRRLTDEKHHRYQWIRWTAAGEILFASDHGGKRNIWIMAGDGTGSHGLTENSGSNYHPAATADGSFIVFTSDRLEPGIDLWRMGPQGENPVRLTTGADASHPTLTPDGRWIYFARGDGAEKSVWRVSINGGDPERVVDGLGQWPAISPDGRFLALYQQVDREKNWSVAILRIADNSLVKRLPLTAPSPIRWSPDSRGIAFVRTEAAVSNIWLQPLDDSPARMLTRFTEDMIVNFDISNDSHLICSRVSKVRDAYLIRNFR
jgi:Tol biopolymer transport system component/DNA-binding winged helix-turn-helix (wHTH) protein